MLICRIHHLDEIFNYYVKSTFLKKILTLNIQSKYK